MRRRFEGGGEGSCWIDGMIGQLDVIFLDVSKICDVQSIILESMVWYIMIYIRSSSAVLANIYLDRPFESCIASVGNRSDRIENQASCKTRALIQIFAWRCRWEEISSLRLLRAKTARPRNNSATTKLGATTLVATALQLTQ